VTAFCARYTFTSKHTATAYRQQAGAGGVSICNGSDFYKFNYNWVCGNLRPVTAAVSLISGSATTVTSNTTVSCSTSRHPTIPTNGGGVLVMGAPDVDPACAPRPTRTA